MLSLLGIVVLCLYVVSHSKVAIIRLSLFSPPPINYLSAIYNYDSRREQELCLQVGDTVHILETFEGEHEQSSLTHIQQAVTC